MACTRHNPLSWNSIVLHTPQTEPLLLPLCPHGTAVARSEAGSGENWVFKNLFSPRQAWGSLAGHQTRRSLNRGETGLSEFSPEGWSHLCSPWWRVKIRLNFDTQHYCKGLAVLRALETCIMNKALKELRVMYGQNVRLDPAGASLQECGSATSQCSCETMVEHFHWVLTLICLNVSTALPLLSVCNLEVIKTTSNACTVPCQCKETQDNLGQYLLL